MKRLIVSLFLATPVLVNANTVQFNTVSNSHYNVQSKATDSKKTGQFGSFSIVDSALGNKSKSNDHIQKLALDNKNTFGNKTTGLDLVTPNFFAEAGNDKQNNSDNANLGLGFMMLKESIGTKGPASKSNFNHLVAPGKFDFLIGRNNNHPNTNTKYYKYEPVRYAANAVPVPAALPLLATAVALFGFGANRRRV